MEPVKEGQLCAVSLRVLSAEVLISAGAAAFSGALLANGAATEESRR